MRLQSLSGTIGRARRGWRHPVRAEPEHHPSDERIQALGRTAEPPGGPGHARMHPNATNIPRFTTSRLATETLCANPRRVLLLAPATRAVKRDHFFPKIRSIPHSRL